MVDRVCKFEGCERRHRARGLCNAHYIQDRTGRALKPVRKPVPDLVPCTFPNCDNHKVALGLCQRHYFLANAGIPLRPLEARRPRSLDGVCTFSGCRNPHSYHGLCSGHNYQQKSGKPLTPLRANRHRAGYTRTDKDGYVHERVQDHPWYGSKFVRQHILIMSKRLGRPLHPGENVHHINGVRDDNRIENLELWNTSQPAGQRIPDKLTYALELLALYEPAWYNAVEEVRRTTMNQKAGTDASEHL